MAPEPSEGPAPVAQLAGPGYVSMKMRALLKTTAAAAGVALAMLPAAGPAHAGQVLRVSPTTADRVEDPLVPPRGTADLGREPGAGAPRATASAAKGPKGTSKRGRKAVLGALTKAARARRISRGALRRYRRAYSRALAVRRRLKGARGRELAAVTATLESIALRSRLTASRMPALFLILRRNTEFWPRKRFPRNRERVTFRGSEILFEYYAGHGLQLQPLLNFKKANIMHSACVKPAGVPCQRAGLARLLREMAATSSQRGGFRTWEYFFRFGGGSPPWMSGMAQATGVQALGRAWQLLGDRRLLAEARAALPAFEAGPPTGIATRGPLGGTHYLQYSFARRLYIFNAFMQSLIGLFDYAEATGDARARSIFERAEPEARMEVPHSDTGDWSTYSFGGRESTREYHELLREFLAGLCSRLRETTYCDTARRFRGYTTDPAELALTGPATAQKGQRVAVRFWLSKLSAVQIVITREGAPELDRTATFRRGEGSFEWVPRSEGTYTVSLAAKELRTGRALRTRTSGTIESLPAP
jgi:hypothetical protein